MFLTRSGILIPPINNRRSKDKTFRTKNFILKPPIPDRRFKDSHFQFSGFDAPKRTTVLQIRTFESSKSSSPRFPLASETLVFVKHIESLWQDATQGFLEP